MEERGEGESVDRSKYSVDDVVPRETRHDGQRYGHEEQAEERRPPPFSAKDISSKVRLPC